MTLEEKMKKYKTVKWDRRPSCGNPWWWDKPGEFECTTCGVGVPKTIAECYDDNQRGKFNVKAMCIFFMLLAGCVDHNVTLYSTLPNQPATTKCSYAIGQDEGGVCWHGYLCSDGVDASTGCWTETNGVFGR